METHSTVQLFLRFRAHGDLDALARVFDACAPKLLGVARHLVRDEALAEDAVQQTFVAAIEDAQRFDATRDLEAWLVGILTNKARDLAARDARRPDPARLDEARSADPATEVELAEFVATLERALERVPAAYREVLRKNLADGRTPAEIAKELARDPNTVRVQLHRGMEHLRRVLPAGFALGAAAIASSPRGLVTLRAEVLEHARDVALAGVHGTASVKSALAKKLVAGAVAVLVLASAALFAVGSRDDAGASSPSSGAVAAQDSATPPATAQLEPSPPRATARFPLAVQAPTTGELDVDVVWHDGTPAADVEVYARPRPWLGGLYDGDRYARTDAQGRARFDSLPPGDTTAGVEYAIASASSVIVAGETRSVRVVVQRHVDVTGRVARVDGSAVAGALVWCAPALPFGNAFAVRSVPIARTDASGLFVARACPRRSVLCATVEGHGTSLGVPLDANGDDAQTIDLVVTPLGAVLELVVRDAAGEPVEGAWGLFAPSRRPHGQPPGLRFRTDANGRARLATNVGEALLTLAARGQPCTEVRLTLPVGTTRHEVVFAPGVWVSGTVRDANGAAQAGASVELDSSAHLATEDERRRLGRTDAAGRYRVGPFATGSFALVASTLDGPRGAREARRFEISTPGETTWDVTLDAVHAIRGRVVDANGAPLAGCEVGAAPNPGLGELSTPVRTDELGRFEVRGVVGVSHEVYARAPLSFGNTSTTRAGVVPDQAEIELQLAVHRAAGAFVVGRVTQAGVGGLIGAKVWLASPGTGSYTGKITTDDGAFEVGPLPPGTYSGRVVHEDRYIRVLDGVIVVGDERKNLGEIALAGYGTAKLVLHGADGVELTELRLFAVDDEQHQNHKLVELSPGVYEHTRLVAGRYTLRTFAGKTRVPERKFDVVAGQMTELTLDCVPATTSVIVFTLPEGSTAPVRLRIDVRQDGELVASHDGPPSLRNSEPMCSLMTALPSGAYTCDADVDGVWTGHATFVVPPSESEPFRLEVPLVHR